MYCCEDKPQEPDETDDFVEDFADYFTESKAVWKGIYRLAQQTFGCGNR